MESHAQGNNKKLDTEQVGTNRYPIAPPPKPTKKNERKSKE
jgi:hypothetical protein